MRIVKFERLKRVLSVPISTLSTTNDFLNTHACGLDNLAFEPTSPRAESSIDLWVVDAPIFSILRIVDTNFLTFTLDTIT
jgi:hypothetical protein